MRQRRLLVPFLLAFALLAVPASSQAFVTGVGDQQPSMFASPFYQALHVKIARYIVPYDAMSNSADRTEVQRWIAAARTAGVKPLIAFYHSRVAPQRMPKPSAYQAEIQKFIRAFPDIREYSAWNEANRGNVSGLFKSPNATQAAQYYEALRNVCKGCSIVGLDVLDSQNISSTIRYIKQFQRHIRHQPSIWGLHNYSDTNRFRNKGTRAVLRAVHGQVWLTETGGVVKFGGAFPNRHGEGLIRAKKALAYMFKLAKSSGRLRRLYIFQWTGDRSDVRFDAGLMNLDGTPRPGYFVVRKYLTGK